MAEFGAPIADMSVNDFACEGYFFRMGIPPVQVDILFSIQGLSFEAAWEKRTESEVDGVKLYFISKEDLIASKLAAGRPQDLLDAATLQLPVKSADEFKPGRQSSPSQPDERE